MKQIARNLIDCVDGCLHGKKYVIHDRDSLFCASFCEILNEGDVGTVKLPPKSPNLNAHAERFVRSIKYECLNKLVLLGEKHLRSSVFEYMQHYHLERPHQGIGKQADYIFD